MTREYGIDSSDIKSIVTVEKGLHTRSDNVEVVTGTVVVGAIVVDGTGRSATVLVESTSVGALVDASSPVPHPAMTKPTATVAAA